ncbi:hypothetical protein GCM10027590_52590 [Nocardiopsis nanhaiensis]
MAVGADEHAHTRLEFQQGRLIGPEVGQLQVGNVHPAFLLELGERKRGVVERVGKRIWGGPAYTEPPQRRGAD